MRELLRMHGQHETLRAKLQQLKSTLGNRPPDLSADGEGADGGARALCFALARQLRAHTEEEGRLAARSMMALERVGPDAFARLALKHHLEQERLDAINLALADESNGWVTYARPVLLRVIAGMERLMDAQEVDLYPFMERSLVGGRRSNEAGVLTG